MLTKKKTDEKTKVQLQSTQAFSPIREIKKGIICTKGGSYIKLMEFTPINFAFRSAAEQESIALTFSAALRVMPNNVQFKVITREANVEPYTSALQRYMESETNEKCRELQQEQINLIEDISKTHGVSRRFFLSFKYEGSKTGGKEEDFNEIYNTLQNRAEEIEVSLARCGNEKVSVDYPDADADAYTKEALYEIMCRDQSREIPFRQREKNVQRTYADALDGKEKNWVYPVNDFLVPSMIDATKSPKYMEVDGLYYSFLYIPSAAYPTYANAGWLQILINMGEGIDLDFWMKKENTAIISKKLRFSLRAQKLKARETEDTSADYEELQNAISSSYAIKNALASGDTFCYMTTVLTITARSLSELKYKEEIVKNFCIKQGIRANNCYFKQSEMFKATLPICKLDPDIYRKGRRNILLSDLGSAYPFTSYAISDPGGVLIGTNESNDSLIFSDIFSTKTGTNANAVIMGQSGSGKSFLLQALALRLREGPVGASGGGVYILAPYKGFEYEKACRAIGGSFIHLSPASSQRINVLEIRHWENKDNQTQGYYSEEVAGTQSILSAKLERLQTFFAMIYKDITPEERTRLDEALMETYKRFGITLDNASLIDPAHPDQYRKMPTLMDLYNVLQEMKTADRLKNVLGLYVSGSASAWNGQTNVDLSNKYTVIDVSDLSEQMLPIAMYIALDLIWDRIRMESHSKKVVFIDEAWQMLASSASSQASAFILELFRTIRGFSGSCILASQNVEEFLAVEGGRFSSAILNNARIKIIMKCEPDEAGHIKEKFKLTDREYKEIMTYSQGHGLYCAGTSHVSMFVESSAMEKEILARNKS